MRHGEKNGDGYWFITIDEFEDDIGKGKFLEYGEYDANFYGTKFDSVRKIIRSGKMCILDLNPQVSNIWH